MATTNLATAQGVPTFCGNSQHTSVFSTPAVNINSIKWSISIDNNNTGAAAHYGAPLITNANTVIAPVKIANNGFQVEAHSSANGSLMYTLPTDYVLPSYDWIPVYQPVLAPGPLGQRLYFAGAGGSIFYVDNPDSAVAPVPVREVFYTDLATYTANASGFNGTIFIDTPITSDSHGNIFFGFRVQGTAPAPLNTTQSGYARIDQNGNGSYVLAGDASSDAAAPHDCHNTAPALSNDESTLYVVTRSATTSYYGYLLGLDTTTLATKYKKFLLDPRNNGNNAGILDDGTASPMVAPDNDVYLGIFGNPYNGSRGFLAHFNSDLSVEKAPGEFGWDNTPGIVPASMVPSYHGSSPYLLFTKYNNYDITDGNGVNRVAVLDPNDTQVDFHSTAPGLVEMREVMTMIGPTPDTEASTSSYPYAVREWCVNACAVNPATDSVFFDSEDGHIYRWDLGQNAMTQCVSLTSGIGEPYVPTIIGPDGTVYTLNGGYLFALGGPSNESLTISSSEADTHVAVLGDSITFTANVSSGSGTPTGTVTFTDLTYNGFTPETTTLASNVPVDANGHASVTTSALQAGGTYFGNHFITASYSGDGTYPANTVSMVQKVHALASTTTVSSSAASSPFGQSVTFTANVSSSSGTPTGYVTFSDGQKVIGQQPVDNSGNASISTSAFGVGSHSISVFYTSDTVYASSTGTFTQTITDGTSIAASANPTSANYGQAVTFAATVTAVDGSAGVPSGMVTFTDGSNTLGSSPVDGSGNASITTSSLGVGTHSVTASFSSTTGWQGSSGAAPTVSITDGTSLAVSSSPNPAGFGQSVTLTAVVSAADSGAGTPTGTVTFTDGSNNLGSAAVDGTGTATLTTSSLGVGAHSIGASFAGSGGWSNSGGTASETIQDGTSTALSSSPNPSSIGQSVTLTATVTAADSGAGTPAGTVTFKDGSTTIGSATVSNSGTASISTTSLAYGSHSLSASFSGTTGWLASSGAASQTVNDTTAPTAPTGVSAVSGPKKGQITVSWSPSTDPDDPVANYQVWRSSKLNGAYTQVATVTGTSYVDNAGNGQTRFYYVIAVDSHGNASARSATTSAKAAVIVARKRR